MLWLAIGLFGCGSALREAREPHAGARVLTVATFNLYFPASGDAETLETVGKTGADVIFLQEVSPAWEGVLRQRYGSAYPHMLFAPAGGAGGLGVLSRFALSQDGLLPAQMKHPAWLVRVHTPGAEVRVLNVHLRASRRRGQGLLPGLFSMGSDHRREIAAFVAACGGPPTLVVGDFNEGPEGPAIDWLERRGFVNALPRHDPGQPTFRAIAGLVRLPLDHILFDGSLEAIDSWVLRSGNSDHWPVLARFELPSAPRVTAAR